MHGALSIPKLVLTHCNVISVGIDVVYVPRIERMLQRNQAHRVQRILKKFMHPLEISRFNALATDATFKSQCSYVAGIWACKEAMLKALPNGYDRPPAISLYTRLAYKSNQADGRPALNMDEDLFVRRDTVTYWKRHLQGTKFVVSIAHDKDYLVSVLLHIKETPLDVA